MRQVLRTGTLGRPRGIGWGGRWEGGSGWGTHVNPWLTHVNVWQKPLKYYKVINLQLIKINEKQTKRTDAQICTVTATGFLYTDVSLDQLLSSVQLFATHGLQQARPPCPSPTPRVYSNRPLSR